MADGVFGVEIVTPEQSLFAGGATSIVLATSEGDLTVLDGHTPLVGDVVHCEVKVEQAEGTLVLLAVHGGFLQVDTSPGAAEGMRPSRVETSEPAWTKRKMLSTNSNTSWFCTSRKYSAMVRAARPTRRRTPGGSSIWP